MLQVYFIPLGTGKFSGFIQLVNILDPLLSKDSSSSFLFLTAQSWSWAAGAFQTLQHFGSYKFRIWHLFFLFLFFFFGQSGIIVVIQLCSLRFSSCGGPEQFPFPFLSLMNCVCSQLHGMSTLQWSHIPPFQSLLDLVLMLDSTHNIF